MGDEEGRLVPVGECRRRLGWVGYRRDDGARTFVMEAHGFIGAPLARDVVDRLAALPADLDGPGWRYVADVRRVVAPSIRNLPHLRRIHGLAHLDRYVVVGTWLSRPILRLAGRLPGGPDAVAATLREALDQR